MTIPDPERHQRAYDANLRVVIIAVATLLDDLRLSREHIANGKEIAETQLAVDRVKRCAEQVGGALVYRDNVWASEVLRGRIDVLVAIDHETDARYDCVLESIITHPVTATQPAGRKQSDEDQTNRPRSTAHSPRREPDRPAHPPRR